MNEAVATGLEVLVRRAGAGDGEAFRELHARYYQRLYAYASFRLRESDGAKDVAQEVFLRMWRRLPGFQFRGEAPFGAWVFGIARHVVADRFRSARAESAIGIERIADESVEFEGAAVSRRLLVDLLSSIPESQREVLILRFVLGMPLAEVAVVVGKSPGAVEQLQLRGLRRLRQELSEE